jgi:hypothetical protein
MLDYVCLTNVYYDTVCALHDVKIYCMFYGPLVPEALNG